MKKYEACWHNDGTAGLVSVDSPREHVLDDETPVYLASDVDARISELEKALRDMCAMYGYVWDRVDGALVCMPENIERFEAAHAAAKSLMVRGSDDQH